MWPKVVEESEREVRGKRGSRKKIIMIKIKMNRRKVGCLFNFLSYSWLSTVSEVRNLVAEKIELNLLRERGSKQTNY